MAAMVSDTADKQASTSWLLRQLAEQLGWAIIVITERLRVLLTMSTSGLYAYSLGGRDVDGER